ncbi:MAG: hypothetical protein ACFE89_02640 [Candidatus Hodarchaeota archaeon]
MSERPNTRIVLDGVEKRQRLYTGHKSFDQYFGIMSGTTTIMYVQNQTFTDPISLLIEWLTRDVNPKETVLLVTTYADPVAIALWCQRKLPPAFKTFAELSLDNRFFWIDMFTYRGFGDHERGLVEVTYPNRIKEMGGNPNLLISPRKPEEIQSVDGLPAAINNIISEIQSPENIRMVLVYADDFIDGVGPTRALNYLHRFINQMRKFGHTLNMLMGWRGTLPEVHTALERTVDQVLRWGYGDVPGLKQPSKFLQILKTTAPDEATTYLKVPYHIRDGKPIVGLGTPLEGQRVNSGRRLRNRS